MDDQLIQKIINKYFTDNPQWLVQHQISSYNNFMENDISRIMKEKNPIRIMKVQDPKTNEFKLRCNLYLGGKAGNKIYYGKPIIYDERGKHYMYPNEARLRNMTYAITIHYDVDVDFFIHTDESEKGQADDTPTHTLTLEKIFLGRFPIMLRSNLCILDNLNPRVRFEMGECKNDYGGYFIIDGKEKCIVSQEKFADNMLYVRKDINELYSAGADIRSVSEDTSKPTRTMSVRMVAPTPSLKNKQIVVIVPNVRKPVPLFIMMRALGVESDYDIIEHCLLDMEKYKTYLELFIPSIHDANKFFNQEVALKYIATFTKGKTIPHALEILSNYFLPHVGEMNFKNKAYFLGHMVREMLRVSTDVVKSTDRDSFRFKRVETPGILLGELFKEYYSLQVKHIFQKIDKEYYYKQALYQGNFIGLIEGNYNEYFAERILEQGVRKAFKGNWGAEAHTKREGVVQDLNRLSYNSAVSQLRKVNLSIDASAKITGPLLLHSSQWGIIDPVDTPDGGNVGLHKHLSLGAFITGVCSAFPIIKWLRRNGNIKLLNESSPAVLASENKIFVNGNWIGTSSSPDTLLDKLKKYRRNALLPIYSSVNWDIPNNIIYIYTDGGRLCRPVFYIDKDVPSYERKPIIEKVKADNFTWQQLITGFAEKTDGNFSISKCFTYGDVKSLYQSDNIETLQSTQAVIEYIDVSEEESSMIAHSVEDYSAKTVSIHSERYTHIEIHPSLILGVMGNQVVFPENNQLPRDLFACGQMKQAVSLYHSNFPVRIDKMGVVLNNGQIPLVKSRYLEKINREQHPYGENVIVGIMCYNGYNVEDAILINEGSVKRGLFRTTYYNMYETFEEQTKVGNSQIDSRFANIEDENVIGLKPGFDYGVLDKAGMIKENTLVDDKTVLIGKVITNLDDPEVSTDSSVFPKKGQLGYVDKTFITEGEEGKRIAKVRIRHERIPNIGDKFCSRCGQKGTIGLLVPEADMPYTDDGIRPDIIVNPHALPSRMTIGQLVETLMGKACSIYGGFGDCTAFMNKGPKHKQFGDMLRRVGLQSSGNQLLYNGLTGEQLQMDIFFGPTYYMRLKHMVKDKINYRARGPRTLLTRQTVQGRANDGGLRVGEMERDGILGHGATKFLQESMLIRGDEYFMAVCNQTGMVAIYNDNYNLFMSPYADGPIRFQGTLDDKLQIDNVSKYGRSFSVLRVPYAFKLLIQELQTMNIQMRIITDKNIDQLTSMSFSDNIVKLMGKETTTKQLIDNVNEVGRKDIQKDIEFNTPEGNVTPQEMQMESVSMPEIVKESVAQQLSTPKQQQDDASQDDASQDATPRNNDFSVDMDYQSPELKSASPIGTQSDQGFPISPELKSASPFGAMFSPELKSVTPLGAPLSPNANKDIATTQAETTQTQANVALAQAQVALAQNQKAQDVTQTIDDAVNKNSVPLEITDSIDVKSSADDSIPEESSNVTADKIADIISKAKNKKQKAYY